MTLYRDTEPPLSIVEVWDADGDYWRRHRGGWIQNHSPDRSDEPYAWTEMIAWAPFDDHREPESADLGQAARGQALALAIASRGLGEVNDLYDLADLYASYISTGVHPE